jgi:hypothetical protein
MQSANVAWTIGLNMDSSVFPRWFLRPSHYNLGHARETVYCGHACVFKGTDIRMFCPSHTHSPELGARTI